MNSQAPSVMAWRLYSSAISARLVYLREIGRTAFWEFATAFWEFCNTICQRRTWKIHSINPVSNGEQRLRDIEAE